MSLSNFAQRAVAVLDAKAGGKLDWDRRDSRGYSTLMLAAFHNNAWLVSHIMRKGKVDPNAENQRTQAVSDHVLVPPIATALIFLALGISTLLTVDALSVCWASSTHSSWIIQRHPYLAHLS